MDRWLEGLAIPTDEWATVREWGSTFRELIMPGAWSEVDPEIPLVVDHDDRVRSVLARAPGSLELFDRDDGLNFAARLSETQLAEDVWRQVRDGTVMGMSWLFLSRGVEDEWEVGPDRIPERTINRLGRIEDISVVTWPTYDSARVAAAEPKPSRAVVGEDYRRTVMARRSRRMAIRAV